MIHYHGTPCGATREDVARFAKGRHMLIPFLRSEDVGTVAEVSQTFCFDNSAFTAWKQGTLLDWHEYYEFCEVWYRHPAFDFAIIPDVIDGSEEENDELLNEWPSHIDGAPVWHMHESLERLDRLIRGWPRVCLGSSGQWATVGNKAWWDRMEAAMEVCCDSEGYPRTKYHGLRMLDPAVFTRLPLASADSTNAVRNSSSYSRFGMYTPPNASTRMGIIAERIEAHQSASIWAGKPDEEQLLLFA